MSVGGVWQWPDGCWLPVRKPFLLKEGTAIHYTPDNERMRRNAEFLASYVERQTGIRLEVKEGGEEGKGILLTLGLEADNPEAYTLEVNQDRVTIAAPTEAGVFYGIQTLRKSVGVAEGGAVELPAVQITDEPRFSYRGMMLDVSRHFFSVDDVKTYIDMLALHNINRLHWHLSDDQGWRIEIKKYPKLTEIASQRKETVIGRNSGKYDGKPYGGFYTQEQAKEIVAYAAERYITVIPEIDLPGHMQAALTAYPELGCTGGPYEVWIPNTTIWEETSALRPSGRSVPNSRPASRRCDRRANVGIQMKNVCRVMSSTRPKPSLPRRDGR